MIELFTDNRSPSMTDTITVSGAAFDLTTSTVKLRMRLASSSTLKIDTAAVIVSAAAGIVRYDWAAADVDTPGLYSAWWHVTLPSTLTQDSPEFDVLISSHGPAGTDLCTVADVHEEMEKQTTATTIDALIQTKISEVSAYVPKRYNHDFAPLGTLTRRRPVFGHVVQLSPYALRSATTITLDPDGAPVVLTSSQYQLEPGGGSTLDATYTWLRLARSVSLYSTRSVEFSRAELEIIGAWGPAAVTPDVARAAARTVASWLSRPIAAANALESFSGGVGEVRPDRFGGFSIPFAAHQVFSQYAPLSVA